jgi:hypothetical protein
MTKKISLEISNETYQQLSKLAEEYNQDTKSVAKQILEVVSKNKVSIGQISYATQEKNLSSILYRALFNYPTMVYLFKDAADAVKAEGEYEIDIANIEIVWDTNYFRFRFDTRNPEYMFGSFEFTKEDERYNVSTYTYLSQENTADGSFDELNDVVESYALPFDEFNMYTDSYEGDDCCTLTIDVWSDQLEELPSLKQINKDLKKILKKAKINLSC